ncbi:hypothetical protein M0811_01371 [Anaeramoeba ignava]|uniref:Probable threonine--tRNA ligase, cytoplasmic n=1 Tax=Anaeramoeba ignava TaxID=1746090 RepID=A0A9Q0R9Q9_ANAIG|nr:hypothetical protein M0811_01371 [Anaeramoeba ignava]
MSQEQKEQKEQKKQKQQKPKKQKQQSQIPVIDVEKLPKPDFIDYRIKMFEEEQKRQEEEKEKQKEEEEKKIEIKLLDGKIIEAVAGKITVQEIAKKISNSFAKKSIVGRINNKDFIGMHDILYESCSIEFFPFDSPEGEHVFWHSSAHLLGEALELIYGAHLCIGPAIEQGFYYEFFYPKEDDQVFNEDEFPKIEQVVNYLIKKNRNFERLEVQKDFALKMFEHNKFKQEIISEKVPDGETCSIYRSGDFVDLCKGPHILNSQIVQGFMLTKIAGSYWKGDQSKQKLQRVYGISFPEMKLLNAHRKFIEEAKKRDHRKIGTDQELFFFTPLSPGCCFFLPHGTRIYHKLQELVQEEYWKREYQEVISPNIFFKELWETSGHWQNYQENMFSFEVENKTFSLKPMNCPSHCVMFRLRPRSYRELPLRIADFGVLHRNEFSGALTGLTRVRRFQQDDAHIFAMPEQVESEINGCLDFVSYIYSIFDLDFDLELSTRPEKFLGEIEMWNKAESALKEALVKTGKNFKINEGDGAFYGPKIDIHVRDSLKRRHQCATIQLDFQLPLRFDLRYIYDSGESAENEKDEKEQKIFRPVIIHRAILGSVERFFAILCEHYGGKWPFWLSPRQAMVVPVSDKNFEYAKEVRQIVHNAGFYCDCDLSKNQLNKKIREAQLAQFNFILVVGMEEQADRTVNVRTRDKVVHGKKSIDELLKDFAEMKSKRLNK